LCDGKPKCVKACQEGRWNTLILFPREEEVSYKTLAKTLQKLTREIAKEILGEETAKEVID